MEVGIVRDEENTVGVDEAEARDQGFSLDFDAELIVDHRELEDGIMHGRLNFFAFEPLRFQCVAQALRGKRGFAPTFQRMW